ncbi:hypothetical protein OIU74_006973 [Salix koriyanagi]|uniref:Uncharacterized protein n=1 Tax=Salix koriyanagi TaxID=2511006 RepID=A0A9Q0Z5Q6_9ROSI|nr:hypothetical protein OIU74_006973 [Salix koriyanagi]
MENKNDTKHADLPSNYVTLAQLQERWVKEQQRKQKEKEQQEEHDHNKLRNTESEPGNLSLSVPVSAPLPSTRRSSNGKSHRWNLFGTGVEKWKAVSVSVLEENVNEKKNCKKNERKEKKKGEAGEQAEEGEVTGEFSWQKCRGTEGCFSCYS